MIRRASECSTLWKHAGLSCRHARSHAHTHTHTLTVLVEKEANGGVTDGADGLLFLLN